MNALQGTDRARQLLERGLRRALTLVEGGSRSATPPGPPGPPPGAPARFIRSAPTGDLGVRVGSATLELYGRLTPKDVHEVETAIERSEQHRSYYAGAGDEIVRRHLVLAFGVDLGVPPVLEKTGLFSGQPPENVHSMARGPVAAAGGLYEADLVADALESVGASLHAGARALDFGCSSGRVVRVLAAAFPEVRWYGCDPNGAAVEWAGAAMPSASFFVNGDEPPLPLDPGSLDVVCAVSIWSHFAPALGLRWFDEMARLIAPGGHLVFTTHGLTSVWFYVVRSIRSVQQSDEIVGALYRDGAWYAAEFGETGDWGVTNPDWGTTFLSPAWLLTQLTPQWRFLEFAPGRNQENQDVFVLQRV